MAVRYQHHHLPLRFHKIGYQWQMMKQKHFTLLADRLEEMLSHLRRITSDGTRQVFADSTKDDLPRLAIAPLVPKYSISPQLLKRFGKQKMPSPIQRSSRMMKWAMSPQVKRWFDYQCGMERLTLSAPGKVLLNWYFHGQLKPPFNISARNAARFSAAFYRPIAASAYRIEPLVTTLLPTRAARLASIKLSRSPSSTPCALPVSTCVRKSFTI